jgi:hypothetical protein
MIVDKSKNAIKVFKTPFSLYLLIYRETKIDINDYREVVIFRYLNSLEYFYNLKKKFII